VRRALSAELVQRVIAAKRVTHAELSRALTWPAIQRICEREGITIRRSTAAMPRPAQLVPFAGGWTILLSRDAPPRRLTYLAAHELGHLWLHHDRQHDRTEIVYNMDAHWPDDPREDDAELFAALVLAGPTRARAMVPEAETRLQFALRTVRRVPRGPR
jgi:Zn-dependent peptidase ImmA (M78 family)